MRPDVRVRLPAAQRTWTRTVTASESRENNDPTRRAAAVHRLLLRLRLRSIDKFPKQGSKAPWRLYQNYARDIFALRFGSLEDGAMEFSRGGGAATGPGPEPREMAVSA